MNKYEQTPSGFPAEREGKVKGKERGEWVINNRTLTMTSGGERPEVRMQKIVCSWSEVNR